MQSIIVVAPLALATQTEGFARALGLGEGVLCLSLSGIDGVISHRAGHVVTDDPRLAALPDSLDIDLIDWSAQGLTPEQAVTILAEVTFHATPMVERFDPYATFQAVVAQMGLGLYGN